MKVILTNDDGIDAVGLVHLEQAVRRIREVRQVVVIAPTTHQSGVSHRVTTDSPIRVDQRTQERFAVDGTPCDCVRLGLAELAPDADWIFSGINDGANLGVDIHMSGTVAAARESAMYGKPAIAWSQYVHRPEPSDWEVAEQMVQDTWTRIQKHGLPRGGFWNVNFPHRPSIERLPTPVLCSPESLPLLLTFRPSKDAFHYAGSYAHRPRTPGRDVDVCFGGGISLSKLTTDRW